MGFVKRWDITDVKTQLGRCSAEANYSGNDGFTAWACKKDLLEVKYYLEELLEHSPTFSDLEAKFVEQKEQEKMFKVLKS